MESLRPPNACHDRAGDSLLPRSDLNPKDLDALRAENRQLRELVVQLSEIVVRNVLDRKGPPAVDLS